MRYTTILDLRDWPSLYKNHNIRLVYLHLVFISGYHDYNRDVANISLRRLAADTGITESACRNALAKLEKYRIITRKDSRIMVRKWLENMPITDRPKSNRAGGVVVETAQSTRDPKAVTKEEWLRMKQAREEKK